MSTEDAAPTSVKKSNRLRGIAGACLTPFDESGHVDYDALERQLEFLIPDCGLIAVGAVEASEYSVLTLQERKRLMREAASIVNGRASVAFGVSDSSFVNTMDLVDWAASAGGDLIQVLMPRRPWGGEPSMSELSDYFSSIAERSPLPIVAYHNPMCGGDPSLDSWVEIGRLPNVHYFKESSRDITKITNLIERIDAAGHAGYFTTMQPLLITLLAGGSGAAMPPPATRIGAHVYRAVEAGRLDEAVRWQRLFSVFPHRWSQYGLTPVMKAAARHFGLDIGNPAAPFHAIHPQHEAEIGHFLHTTGATTAAVADVDVLVSEMELYNSTL